MFICGSLLEKKPHGLPNEYWPPPNDSNDAHIFYAFFPNINLLWWKTAVCVCRHGWKRRPCLLLANRLLFPDLTSSPQAILTTYYERNTCNFVLRGFCGKLGQSKTITDLTFLSFKTNSGEVFSTPALQFEMTRESGTCTIHDYINHTLLVIYCFVINNGWKCRKDLRAMN